MSVMTDGRADRSTPARRRLRNPFRRRSAMDVSPLSKFVGWLVLVFWAFLVLFPLYWLFVTSFKTPNAVAGGPFYVPFVDFQPTLDAWRPTLDAWQPTRDAWHPTRDAWHPTRDLRDGASGGGGIRTHGPGVARSTAFKAAAFDRSATPPGFRSREV